MWRHIWEVPYYLLYLQTDSRTRYSRENERRKRQKNSRPRSFPGHTYESKKSGIPTASTLPICRNSHPQPISPTITRPTGSRETPGVGEGGNMGYGIRQGSAGVPNKWRVGSVLWGDVLHSRPRRAQFPCRFLRLGYNLERTEYYVSYCVTAGTADGRGLLHSCSRIENLVGPMRKWALRGIVTEDGIAILSS